MGEEFAQRSLKAAIVAAISLALVACLDGGPSRSSPDEPSTGSEIPTQGEWPCESYSAPTFGISFTCPAGWFQWDETIHPEDGFLSATFSNKHPIEKATREFLDEFVKFDIVVVLQSEGGPEASLRRKCKRGDSNGIPIQRCGEVEIAGVVWIQVWTVYEGVRAFSMATTLEQRSYQFIGGYPVMTHFSWEGREQLESILESVRLTKPTSATA